MKRLISVLAASLILLLLPFNSASAALKIGATCTTLNKVAKSGSNILSCQKSGSKKIWKIDKNLTMMCRTFNAIPEWAAENNVYIPSKEGSTGPVQPKDQAGWDQRLVFIDELIKYSPKQYKERAQLYRSIVQARAEMLAAYDFILVSELPADVRKKFINEHFADQLKADEVINYWKSTCR